MKRQHVKTHLQLEVRCANEVSTLLTSHCVYLGRNSSAEAAQSPKGWMLLYIFRLLRRTQSNHCFSGLASTRRRDMCQG